MTQTPERRLAELGLQLPTLRPKAGQYEGWVHAGDLLFLNASWEFMLHG